MREPGSPSERSPPPPAASAPCARLLIQRYAELHRLALCRTGSPALADEVMQEAWLRLAAPPGTTPARRPVSHPLAYVQRVVIHLCIDCGRRQQRWQCRHGEACLAARIASQAPMPCEVAASQQECAQLLQAIRQLPPRCRQVFVLYRLRQLTMREIAEQLQLAPKTVEHHVAHAVQACRRHLQRHGHPPR